jgi:uncharacterized protein (DUF1778 family)
MSDHERLEFRIKQDVKEIIQKAADISHLTLTDFMINTAHFAALKFLDNHQFLTDFMKENAITLEEIKNKN